MTDYKSLIPPVGMDHIEYALKRVGYSAARIRVRNINDANIVSAHAIGPSVRLVIRKPADPYYTVAPSTQNPNAWIDVKRIIKRFSIQEIIDYQFSQGVMLASNTKTDLVAALNNGGIGLLLNDVKVEFQHQTAIITVTNPNTLIAYGTGVVNIVQYEEFQV